jgi:hypothetical protein
MKQGARGHPTQLLHAIDRHAACTLARSWLPCSLSLWLEAVAKRLGYGLGSSRWSEGPRNQNQIRSVFRSRVGSPDSAKVATVFLFFSAKKYPKNDKLDSKCSSRKVQQNCAISFWFHLHLVLHAFADILMLWAISFLHSGIWVWIWKLNKG